VTPSALPQRVSDARANRNELIEHAVSKIGRSKHRRAVFEAIYYHKSRVKSADQVAEMTELPRNRVLQEANALAKQQIIGRVKRKGELIAYEQEEFYQANKLEILRQLDDRRRRERFPTKRTPRSEVTVSLRKSLPAGKVRFLTIDEIDSFKEARRVKANPTIRAPSESAFKRGLQRIIGEEGKFSDWGGEQNDLFTTWLSVGGKRRRAALALKGPATKGRLTLRQMGKNADQIQRLFKSAADVFLVQYHGEIDQMIVAEMETHARDLAHKTERRILFGVIDGQDSRRLIAAYPDAFL
jgi:hypothetical protein